MKRTVRPKIVNAASQVEDAGMILEVFQDAVDEVEIPDGYNWDYKIDQLDSGETAGQLFIMADDNQPVYFATFSLEKDGQFLDILNDKKLYDSLVRKVKKSLDELGDFEEYVGKPKQETIELATKISSPIIASANIYLLEFMYRYFQESDELPSYDDVLEEYDEDTDIQSYEYAYHRLDEVVYDIEYYEDYIELHDDPTLTLFDISDEAMADMTGETIQAEYADRVDEAVAKFERETGVELYLLGRSGRHACVEDTIENALSYHYLRSTALELEQEVIDYMNYLGELYL